jgi:hypothetical protein
MIELKIIITDFIKKIFVRPSAFLQSLNMKMREAHP